MEGSNRGRERREMERIEGKKEERVKERKWGKRRTEE